MTFPFLGFGVGLRPRHYQTILRNHPRVDWFEVIAENYMVAGGRHLYFLDKIRERYPIVMHGVSLSIGSTDPLNQDYLKKLKGLAKRVNPAWISDHLCWTGVNGSNGHDLYPLPYTDEAIRHVVRRVRAVQDCLGQRILLENVSSYLEFDHSSMPEWLFLREIAEEADCGILLDLNNIFVSSFNHHYNPFDYLEAIPRDRVSQFHLAGPSNHKRYLLDTHDHPIRPEVWDLYRRALERFGPVSTLIEWDEKIPPFSALMGQLKKAKSVYHRECEPQHAQS
jgi:hypothetical protein